jgi:hypothetical protein
VDIIADLEQGEARPLVAALAADYYASGSQIVDAVRRRGSFNVIHHATGIKIEVFVAQDAPLEREIAARVIQEKLKDNVDSGTPPVSPAEDLLLQKLRWRRKGGKVLERRWQDIPGILRVEGTAIDLEYSRHWAARIGVTDLRERALAEG